MFLGSLFLIFSLSAQADGFCKAFKSEPGNASCFQKTGMQGLVKQLGEFCDKASMQTVELEVKIHELELSSQASIAATGSQAVGGTDINAGALCGAKGLNDKAVSEATMLSTKFMAVNQRLQEAKGSIEKNKQKLIKYAENAKQQQQQLAAQRSVGDKVFGMFSNDSQEIISCLDKNTAVLAKDLDTLKERRYGELQAKLDREVQRNRATTLSLQRNNNQIVTSLIASGSTKCSFVSNSDIQTAKTAQENDRELNRLSSQQTDNMAANAHGRMSSGTFAKNDARVADLSSGKDPSFADFVGFDPNKPDPAKAAWTKPEDPSVWGFVRGLVTGEGEARGALKDNANPLANVRDAAINAADNTDANSISGQVAGTALTATARAAGMADTLIKGTAGYAEAGYDGTKKIAGAIGDEQFRQDVKDNFGAIFFEGRAGEVAKNSDNAITATVAGAVDHLSSSSQVHEDIGNLIGQSVDGASKASVDGVVSGATEMAKEAIVAPAKQAYNGLVAAGDTAYTGGATKEQAMAITKDVAVGGAMTLANVAGAGALAEGALAKLGAAGLRTEASVAAGEAAVSGTAREAVSSVAKDEFADVGNSVVTGKGGTVSTEGLADCVGICAVGKDGKVGMAHLTHEQMQNATEMRGILQGMKSEIGEVSEVHIKPGTQHFETENGQIKSLKARTDSPAGENRLALTKAAQEEFDSASITTHQPGKDISVRVDENGQTVIEQSKNKSLELEVSRRQKIADASRKQAISDDIADMKDLTKEERLNTVAENGRLNNAERIQEAQRTLRTDTLSAEQQKAIIEAHEVGKGEAGYGTYTREQLREKSKILKDAGFTKDEREVLMRKGITGEADSLDFTSAAKSEAPKLSDTAQQIKELQAQGLSREEIKAEMLKRTSVSRAPASAEMDLSSIENLKGVTVQDLQGQTINVGNGKTITLQSKLGEGSAGTVYDIGNNKVIKIANDPGAVVSLKQEVEYASKVEAAGIPTVPIEKGAADAPYLIKPKLDIKTRTAEYLQENGGFSEQQKASLNEIYSKMKTNKLNLDLNPANLYWDANKGSFVMLENAPPMAGKSVSTYWQKETNFRKRYFGEE